MSLYAPRHFAEGDLAALDALLARDAFVTLVTVGEDGLPFASHLPVLWSRDGEAVTIEGHWARPNPQSAHAGPALMIVHGPHAYVSPAWYVDKEPAARVPTWNYCVAHLTGRLETSADPAVLASLVSRLSDHHEAKVGSDWSFDGGRDEHARQLRGIVAFRFRPERIELKFKLSQNHPEANVRGAIAGLRALGTPAQSEIADLMQDRLERR